MSKLLTLNEAETFRRSFFKNTKEIWYRFIPDKKNKPTYNDSNEWKIEATGTVFQGGPPHNLFVQIYIKNYESDRVLFTISQQIDPYSTTEEGRFSTMIYLIKLTLQKWKELAPTNVTINPILTEINTQEAKVDPRNDSIENYTLLGIARNGVDV